jgi:hypothetical protein
MPRITKRTPEVVETILSRLSNGELLTVICRESEDLPHPATWRNWCDADETLALAYARARDLGEEVIAAQCIAIAEDGQNDYMEKLTREGSYVALDSEHVQRSKLRIETRLKLLAIWNPRKYGAKLDVTTKDQPISHDMGDIATKAAALLANAKGRKDGA